MYKKVNELGVHCTVVGGAITRPKQITERFVEAVKIIHKHMEAFR